MEVKDLAGFGRPLEKAVEAIRAAVGAWYEPHQIRRRASAEADASLILAKAEIQKSEIARRAAERLAFREIKRQSNIEQIANASLAYLPKKVSDEPPDKDWITGFFDRCQDIGDERLHEIWARILAGEIAEPGAFSSRTLSVLKDMNQRDAAVFTRFCRHVFDGGGDAFFTLTDVDEGWLGEARLRAFETAHLVTIGLVFEKLGLAIDESGREVRYFGGRYLLQRGEGSFGDLPVQLLSFAGAELIRIVEPEEIDDYPKKVDGILNEIRKSRLLPIEKP